MDEWIEVDVDWRAAPLSWWKDGLWAGGSSSAAWIPLHCFISSAIPLHQPCSFCSFIKRRQASRSTNFNFSSINHIQSLNNKVKGKWKRELRWVWLESKPITVYAVIKNFSFYGGGKQTNQLNSHSTSIKQK